MLWKTVKWGRNLEVRTETGVTIFYKVARVHFIEKMKFQQRLEGSEGVAHVYTLHLGNSLWEDLS